VTDDAQTVDLIREALIHGPPYAESSDPE